MSTELATTAGDSDEPSGGLVAAIGHRGLLEAFLAGRKPTTWRAYQADLADFARFSGAASAGAAAELFVALPHGQANGVALAWRHDMTGRGLKAATIARRLAALRSMVKLARTLGRVAWSLDVASPRTEPYRDTAGPGADGWRVMLAQAELEAGTRHPKRVRDLALVRLLHDLGLRRAEAATLDLADLDLAAGAVAVIGKGKTDAIRLTLPGPTRQALTGWLEARGLEAGPLFVRLDRAGGAEDLAPLTGEAVRLIVRDLARRAGLPRAVWPHALRHAAITEALDRTGGNVRAVQRFSRHANPQVLMRYDDNRTDLAGDIARLIAEG